MNLAEIAHLGLEGIGLLWGKCRRLRRINRGIGEVVGLNDDNALAGDDLFGGVEEGEAFAVELAVAAAAVLVGEELEGLGLEGEGELLEHP